MTREATVVAGWWTAPPERQVSYLIGVEEDLLRLALDPLPLDAPAVITYRPTGATHGTEIDALLDDLDRLAIELFPRWLPGAEMLDGPHPLGVQAARALARQAAGRSHNFGPFLADLAERALRGRDGGSPRFPAEVRAAGLGRVIADAYGRPSTVLLIVLPDELAPAAERGLVAAVEWLAHHGQFTVWMAGPPLHTVDRLRTVPIVLPAYFGTLETGTSETGTDGLDGELAGRSLTHPPLSGVPRPDSPAECALERALGPHQWADGREWNHHFERHILAKPYRLDLFWAIEGLVVEIDGPDHRERLKFADDRHRDVQLQLLGYDVLRFTNEQVLSDVEAVVLQIRQLLDHRRAIAARIAK